MEMGFLPVRLRDENTARPSDFSRCFTKRRKYKDTRRRTFIDTMKECTQACAPAHIPTLREPERVKTPVTTAVDFRNPQSRYAVSASTSDCILRFLDVRYKHMVTKSEHKHSIVRRCTLRPRASSPPAAERRGWACPRASLTCSPYARSRPSALPLRAPVVVCCVVCHSMNTR